jgi:phosphocarrier protein
MMDVSLINARSSNMFIAELVVNNKTGLHARPASELVEISNKFQSDVTIVSETGDEVNCKSILSVLLAGMHQGTKITLQVVGSDEDIAGKAIVELIENLID